MGRGSISSEPRLRDCDSVISHVMLSQLLAVLLPFAACHAMQPSLRALRHAPTLHRHRFVSIMALQDLNLVDDDGDAVCFKSGADGALCMYVDGELVICDNKTTSGGYRLPARSTPATHCYCTPRGAARSSPSCTHASAGVYSPASVQLVPFSDSPPRVCAVCVQIGSSYTT